ncbi:uncharacterized protein Tco025E_02452 [Trypanosoma conorhini]|uniref:Uncharacterized protein n=1 Tax=Trypanosoma conorhini TaxID=83891 RepID=A0A422Q3H5_9TRYP|nr:uncharacterized protein Tco025E_02452 [Trypanosoma conorhini]RNF24482.1 hypothetical protein Tco025E_02452 [Trypanosoma conorhini]
MGATCAKSGVASNAAKSRRGGARSGSRSSSLVSRRRESHTHWEGSRGVDVLPRLEASPDFGEYSSPEADDVLSIPSVARVSSMMAQTPGHSMTTHPGACHAQAQPTVTGVEVAAEATTPDLGAAAAQDDKGRPPERRACGSGPACGAQPAETDSAAACMPHGGLDGPPRPPSPPPPHLAAAAAAPAPASSATATATENCAETPVARPAAAEKLRRGDSAFSDSVSNSNFLSCLSFNEARRLCTRVLLAPSPSPDPPPGAPDVSHAEARAAGSQEQQKCVVSTPTPDYSASQSSAGDTTPMQARGQRMGEGQHAPVPRSQKDFFEAEVPGCCLAAKTEDEVRESLLAASVKGRIFPQQLDDELPILGGALATTAASPPRSQPRDSPPVPTPVSFAPSSLDSELSPPLESPQRAGRGLASPPAHPQPARAMAAATGANGTAGTNAISGLRGQLGAERRRGSGSERPASAEGSGTRCLPPVEVAREGYFATSEIANTHWSKSHRPNSSASRSCEGLVGSPRVLQAAALDFPASRAQSCGVHLHAVSSPSSFRSPFTPSRTAQRGTVPCRRRGLLSPFLPAPPPPPRPPSPPAASSKGKEGAEVDSRGASCHVRRCSPASPQPERPNWSLLSSSSSGHLYSPGAEFAPSTAGTGANSLAGVLATAATRCPAGGRNDAKHFCRWCEEPYGWREVCAVAGEPHSVLRLRRKHEKATKKRAQKLLRSGRIQEAVSELQAAGIV